MRADTGTTWFPGCSEQASAVFPAMSAREELLFKSLGKGAGACWWKFCAVEGTRQTWFEVDCAIVRVTDKSVTSRPPPSEVWVLDSLTDVSHGDASVFLVTLTKQDVTTALLTGLTGFTNT